MALIPGAVVLLFTWWWRRYLPYGRWPRWGYRSVRSLRDREAWDQAQALAAEFLWWSGWLVLNTGLTCRLLDMTPRTGILVAAGSLLVLLVVLRFFVEGQLERQFRARNAGAAEEPEGEDLPLRPS